MRGTGIYDGTVTDPPLKPDLSAGVVIGFGSTKALIVNLGETSGGSISGGSGTDIIASETVLLGMRGPIISGGAADGKTIVWTYFDKNCFRAFQSITDPKNAGNKLFQGTPMGSMQNPPASTDSSWVTLLTFAKCSQCRSSIQHLACLFFVPPALPPRIHRGVATRPARAPRRWLSEAFPHIPTAHRSCPQRWLSPPA